ncbi:MAG TPA: hypothetical protein VNB49_05145, partial [Candidatus Dormibacteraeota bacterium]|nr:hypothetical protein [Candidatus Dormibacteraeota bacterium]
MRGLIVFVSALVMLSIGVWGFAREREFEKVLSPDDGQSAKAFLGRWDLTLKSPDREYPSWLELREEKDYLYAQFVGRWGNARPLPKATLSNAQLTFVSPKEEEGAQADMVFEGTLTSDHLSGTVNGPDGKTWHWTGQRAPALMRAKPPKWGKPIELFKKKDLAGWRMSEPNSEKVWRVENSELITPGNGPELIN